MKIFILDGYNVIHRIPEIREKLRESLDAAREALAGYLRTWRKRYPNAQVFIVFDGKDNEFLNGQKREIAGIRCIFTRSCETADEKIISLIENARKPGDIAVITEDNSIRSSSRARGAEVKPVEFLLKRKNKKEKEIKGADKIPPAVNTRRVTDYYEEHLRETGNIP